MDPAWIVAAVALATAVIGCLAWCARQAWRILVRTTQFLDDYFGEPGRPGVPSRPGVMARLQAVEASIAHVVAETSPNHGKSLRDIVHRTAEDVAEIKAEQAAMRDRMESHHPQRSDGKEMDISS